MSENPNPVCTCGKCNTLTLSIAEISGAIDVILKFANAQKGTPEYVAADESIKFIINSFAVATAILEETMKFLRDYPSLSEDEKKEIEAVSKLYLETIYKFRKIDKEVSETIKKDDVRPKAVYVPNSKFDGTFH